MNQVIFAQTDFDEEFLDTIAIPTKSTITIPPFNRINPDTLKIGVNDEIVFDSYCALGMPAVYDALHSFHSRRMDKFGGYINWKIIRICAGSSIILKFVPPFSPFPLRLRFEKCHGHRQT